MEETIRLVVRESLHDKSIFNSLANIIKDTVAGALVAEMKATLDKKNTEVLMEMKTALEKKDKKIADLESKLLEKNDDLEQYHRRQCLRIFGVEETREEDTDKLVIDVAAKIGVDLQIRDIDRCHRVGRMLEGSSRSRAIIVKFVSYRQRNEVFKNKRKLKGLPITIREDLTRHRHKLLQECITRYGVTNVWTIDGTSVVKRGDKISCHSRSRFAISLSDMTF
ncbi:hypothetical protein C0J52_17952 [Blattella germanica]|nr:hypothetical protein C0J52_17952 [Blattella germanica]